MYKERSLWMAVFLKIRKSNGKINDCDEEINGTVKMSNLFLCLESLTSDWNVWNLIPYKAI